jgi:hypothetical protein
MKLHTALLVFIAVLLGGLGWQRSLAQSDQEKDFEQTGHTVTGEFLNAYQSVSNPLRIYGYPITEAFQDPLTNNLVQYFQKARFELLPEAPDGKRVLVSPLGKYLYVAGKPVAIPDNSPACRLFLESNFKVCYAFLAFFDENGGEAQFGEPVSDIEIHNNQIVQYFQQARFEWHPEMPSGQRVLLTDLGTEYFFSHGENPIRLLPESGDRTIRSVIGLHVRAFPVNAITAANGSQTINIIVQDQMLLPVRNATISLIVRMPSGQEERYIVPDATNSNGITQFNFKFSSNAIGVAKIQVAVMYGNLKTQTITSFRIWW